MRNRWLNFNVRRAGFNATLAPMAFDSGQSLRFRPRHVSWRVWAGTRVSALILACAALLALYFVEPTTRYSEPNTIEGVVLRDIELAKPRPRVIPPPDIPSPPLPRAPNQPQAQSKAEPQSQSPIRPNTQSAQPPLVAERAPQAQQLDSRASRPTPPQTQASGVPGPSAPNAPPRVASSPASQSGAGAGQSSAGPQGAGGPAPRLGGGTLAILRARECARLDMRDRPADCPPNAELQRLLAEQRGPQYRPENAEGFSRNEQAWRGIPPPCLDDGENAAIKGTTLCIRFGNIPSRVRSVREICEARGLGGCAPTPDQAAVNAARKQP